MNLDIGKELSILASIILYSIALATVLNATKIGGKRVKPSAKWLIDLIIGLVAVAAFWLIFATLDSGVVKGEHILVTLGLSVVFYRVVGRIIAKIQARKGRKISLRRQKSGGKCAQAVKKS